MHPGRGKTLQFEHGNLTPKKEIDMSVSWSIIQDTWGKLGKTHPNWQIVSVWDVDALFTLWEHTFFSSHLISFCSMDSNMVCAQLSQYVSTHQPNGVGSGAAWRCTASTVKKGAAAARKTQETAAVIRMTHRQPMDSQQAVSMKKGVTWKILPKKHPESSKPLQLCSLFYRYSWHNTK